MKNFIQSILALVLVASLIVIPAKLILHTIDHEEVEVYSEASEAHVNVSNVSDDKMVTLKYIDAQGVPYAVELVSSDDVKSKVEEKRMKGHTVEVM